MVDDIVSVGKEVIVQSLSEQHINKEKKEGETCNGGEEEKITARTHRCPYLCLFTTRASTGGEGLVVTTQTTLSNIFNRKPNI